MKYRLLDVLACPGCGSGLEVIELESELLAGSLPKDIAAPRCEKSCPWGARDKNNYHKCSDCLRHDIRTAVLHCGNNHLFPVLGGIPRMIPGAFAGLSSELEQHLPRLPEFAKKELKKQADGGFGKLDRKFENIYQSFSSQWDKTAEDLSPWGMNIEKRRKLFLQLADIEPENLAGMVILDAGCGHGELELALDGSGAEVFALELSSSVDLVQRRVKAAGLSCELFTHIVQGNICEIPFSEEAFDCAHSSGVLHHLPDTFSGLASVAATVKPGGRCAIWLYGNESKNSFDRAICRATSAIRAITTRMPHRLLHTLCYCAAPFFWTFTRLYRKQKEEWFRKRTLRELELSLFDAFSPRYRWHHRRQEASAWFRELGFNQAMHTYQNRAGFGCVAAKPSK